LIEKLENAKERTTITYSCSLVRICHSFPNVVCPKFKIMNGEDYPGFTKTIMHIMVLKQPCNWSTRPIMAMDNILEV